MNPSALAVVIPAYNEAATIAGVVASVREIGHVIVIDDCSRDTTASLAREEGAEVLSLVRNVGYEAALNAGFEYAFANDYEYILTMDADGQHRAESVRRLLNALGDADIAIGLRHTKQRLVEWISSCIGSLLWGVSDPFSGLKLYRSSSCKDLAPFDRHRLVGAELFVRAHREGRKLVCVPIQTLPRADMPRFGTNWGANLRLAKACVLLSALHCGVVR
jgi:glycosyltransferase involved in cell wall biosynthesis